MNQNAKMNKLSSMLVLLITKIYIADSYTLTANVLNQLGYNSQSNAININDHNIDSIDPNALNGYDNLTYFHVGYGLKTIEEHTFEGLSSLTILDLRNNLLTSLEYLHIPKQLNSLILCQNKMNYFSLSRTIGVLKKLDISNNRFRSFKSTDFTLLANLTHLKLSNNPHDFPNVIPGHLKSLVNLRSINIANLSINSIDSNFFKANTKLRCIFLSKNKISSLDNRSLIGLNDLVTVSLDYNKLTKIVSGTFQIINNPNLSCVDLSNNLVSQIGDSSFYGNAKMSVNLSNNKLREYLKVNSEILT